MLEVGGASTSPRAEVFAGRALETLREQPRASAPRGQPPGLFVTHSEPQLQVQAGR